MQEHTIKVNMKSKLKKTWNYVKELFKPKNIALTTMLTTAALLPKETKAQEALDYIIRGQIKSGTTGQGIQGIEVKRILYNNNWPLEADTSTKYTDEQGYFNTTFTGIEEIITIDNIGQIKYNIINTPTIELNLEKISKVQIKIHDLLGQEIKTLLDEETNKKTVNTNIDNLASGLYIIQTIIDGKPYTNKILKTEKKYNYGTNKQEITKETKKTLEKITLDPYLYYGFNITDPNGQYYTQQFQPWNGYHLNSTNIEHNTPLLEKKDLDYPFISPRNGSLINTTKDLLFYQHGIPDILQHEAYFVRVKPILVHLDLEDLPSYYTEQQIRDATNYMVTITGQQPDRIWQEVPNRISPYDTLNSTIDYQFKPASEMQGYDMIIGYIRENNKTESHDFLFNKDTIEPEYIKKAIQLAWQFSEQGAANRIPNNNYHSQGLRNNIEELNPDEIRTYNYTMQIEHRTWIGIETIIDGPGNNTTITKTPIHDEQPQSYQIGIKFKDNETIIQKKAIDIELYKQMTKQLEEKDLR